MVAKRMLSSYMHDLARELAPRMIRANVVHPPTSNTDMLAERADVPVLPSGPGAPDQGRRHARVPLAAGDADPWIEPVDISNAVLYLASDEARYVTGMQLRVDAGGYLKWYDFHQ